MVKMRQRHVCVFEFEQGSSDEILAYIQYNADFMRDRLLAFNTDVTPEIRDFLHSLGAMPFKVENKKLLQQGKVKEFSEQIPVQKESKSTATQKIKITLDSSDLTHVVMETIADTQTQSLPVKSSKESLCVRTTAKDSEKVLSQSLPKKMNEENLSANVNEKSMNANMHLETFKRTIRSGEEITTESAIFTKDINAGAFIKSYGNLHIYGKCNGILECFGDYIIIGEFAMGRISLQNINLEGKMLEAVKSSKKLKMLTVENGVISLCEL